MTARLLRAYLLAAIHYEPASMPGVERTPRYPLTVIALHWMTAAAVVGLVVLGWWMQVIPKDPVGPRADAYNLHKSLGLSVLLLMLLRLAWRASHRPPELPPLPAWQAWSARAVHGLLYALMFAVAFSGYLGSATSGFPVKFFGVLLPAWTAANPALKELCSVVHLATSWMLVAAIAIHLLATLHHQWVLRDGLLWRMWPR
ncbi:MAG TPA: cytochrome b [Casimicrobiaceae bacterium]|nr:cytochrome b [Casimicrobiaceae bacterium]